MQAGSACCLTDRDDAQMNAQPLISTLVGAFVVAFIFGMIANRLRISPIVGFLLAGIVIGPFTPGFVGDVALAPELAEIGVVLLMFGIGLHFSIRDLLSVRMIAIPGALVQIVVAIGLGSWLAYALGWAISTGMVFGLALSTASTVVLLRALEERRVINTQEGRIAVGWLIVQDIAMVVALVVVPTLSSGLGVSVEGSNSALKTLLAVVITLGKVTVFIALMLVVGRRFIPWALHRVSKTGSRELFTLAVLVMVLGVAYGSAALFDVSFALGAFFAGLVLHESELSQKAATETLPLRDAFAVLFFVAVGMLFDPSILIRQPWAVVATLLIIVVGKSFAAWLIVLAFGYSRRMALTISVSLAQIGEFSFMLAELSVTLGLLITRRARLDPGGCDPVAFNQSLFVRCAWVAGTTNRSGRTFRAASSIGKSLHCRYDMTVCPRHPPDRRLCGTVLENSSRPRTSC